MPGRALSHASPAPGSGSGLSPGKGPIMRAGSPVGGSTLVSIPVCLYLFFQGEMLRGFLLLGWSLGIVGTVDNVLKPLLIGNRLGLPVLLLFFGILGGIALFGALGIVLGPVIFALLRALLDLYSEEYVQQEKQRVSYPASLADEQRSKD